LKEYVLKFEGEILDESNVHRIGDRTVVNICLDEKMERLDLELKKLDFPREKNYRLL
jgi:hypothetical protein